MKGYELNIHLEAENLKCFLAWDRVEGAWCTFLSHNSHSFKLQAGHVTTATLD